MARINVEDSLWSDRRFLQLCIKIGDEARAIGYVVLAWKLAQKHWCPDRSPIPKADFVKNCLPMALVESGLAEESERGIKMCGSEEHFSWWFERSAAGKKSAEARKEKYGSAQPSPNTPRTAPNGTSTLARTSISSSSSSSSSSSNSDSFSNKNTVSEAHASDAAVKVASKKIEDGKKAQLLIKHYCEEYKRKHRGTPAIHGKTVGLVNAVLKAVSLEKAKDMVTVFFQVKDPWFQKTRHRFDVFYQNFEQIGAALDAGKPLQDDSPIDDWFEEMKRKEAVVIHDS